MTQEDKILAYMQEGRPLTPALAYEKFGTLALHSRIAALRLKGHAIEMRMVTHNGQRWGCYTMRNAPEVPAMREERLSA